MIRANAIKSLVRSKLWNSVADYIHISWVDIGYDYQSLSGISRSLLVSNIIEIPAYEFDELSDQHNLQFYERLVQSPVRFLLLAGICVNPDCKNIGITSNSQLNADEIFATNLSRAFSMKERFTQLAQEELNAIQLGLRLFCKNLGQNNQCIWDLCKLSLDKKLVESVSYSDVNEVGVHASALHAVWRQIDNYISHNHD